MLDSVGPFAYPGSGISGDFMAYLRWRRFTELASLDRPWLGELLMRKRNRPIVAAPVETWDAEHQDEAVINTPWGGGWLVAVVRPKVRVE